ncbi:hypothetical protein [Actinokineospora sp. NBRC 105648]|uniref:hypothetical protein n=1 Tax=Actinokineospora sp. NBRC 105648 TaxID=3032206 RepID=UPI0024A35523|nr:hypothetical protein [Actinokineospora sp. NBRC 105648]GLZ39192.1 hypothetical protein Acsp05_28160 [Actinokineospora sp. NBRC 105648]
MTELSMADLLAAADDLDARSRGIVDRLGAVTASARGRHGITVTVNLEGMLTGLDLGRAARSMSGHALAAEIQALVHRASVAALSDGVDILAPFAAAELLAETQDSTAEDPEDDFATQTWRLAD